MTRSGTAYTVKEIFYSLQGEGAQSGRAAVFCRFSGCNLWTGREANRNEAICRFCDTDFVGVDGSDGGRFTNAETLAQTIAAHWPGGMDDGSEARPQGEPYVVCTGGEPLLQLDTALIDALHRRGFTIGVETNGTRPRPAGLDWVCVSPKAGAPLLLDQGDEIKLVFPQPGAPPDRYEHLAFRHFFLQPMDGPEREDNIRLAISCCLRHPRWRLSLQMHKLVGLR